MVEFIVAGTFVLVPLFLAISIFGKSINVQHTAEVAARYGAWERTVWYEASPESGQFDRHNGPNRKSADEIRNEIGVRVLNDRSSETVVNAGDRGTSSFAKELDPMFQDMAGTAYMTDYSQLSSAQASVAPERQIAGTALDFLRGVPMFERFLPAVPQDNLATATIRFASVAKSSEAYKRLWPDAAWTGLDFEARSGILSNTWAANSSVGTKDMVADIVPAARDGRAVREQLTANQGAILLWDPMAGAGVEVGRIADDEVPPDRLK
jgi:hypothetical protein